MSIRYGIGISLEPGFTSLAYRARQLICGQYASWAAEMNMVYLPVSHASGFFQCPESASTLLDAGLASIAADSRKRMPQFGMTHLGVGTSFGAAGHIFLDFATPQSQLVLPSLRDSIDRLLGTTLGIVSGSASEIVFDSEGKIPLHLPLMQYAKLPAAVFEDAVEFAQAVVTDLQAPADTKAWRLLLLRFDSEAAGDNWSGGGWAADLRWELLASHPL